MLNAMGSQSSYEYVHFHEREEERIIWLKVNRRLVRAGLNPLFLTISPLHLSLVSTLNAPTSIRN